MATTDVFEPNKEEKVIVQAGKIAMVVPYRFVPPQNGGHQAAFGFCAFLAQERPFICLCTDNNDPAKAPFRMLPLFRDKLYKYASPKVAWRCYRALKQEQAAVCITFQPFIVPLLLPVMRWLGIPLHIYIQNLEYRRFRSMGRWFWPILFGLEWLSFWLAQHLYFISPDDLPPAVRAFGIPATKCSVVAYGAPHQEPPKDVEETRRAIRKKHGFGEAEFLIIFFGPQSYPPNLKAVELILHHLNPLLMEKADSPYRFLICGGGLPGRYQALSGFANVEYLGFVEDIEAYVKAADVMINPVNTGGGVKTKLIEAIALGKTVVSSQTGALGVSREACGLKLIVVEDEDYAGYCEALLRLQTSPAPATPPAFYRVYYWGNIIRRMLEGKP